MKTFLITILLVANTVSFAQSTEKAVLNSWDSLFMRHEQELKFHNGFIAKKVYRSDTLVAADSMVVTMFSKSSIPLQRTIHYFDASGCVKFVRSEYYNSRGFMAYVRSFKQSCPVKVAVREEDREFYPICYERFEYDENGNLVIWVYNISTSVTYKETFVNENGQWVNRRQRIKEWDFWK